MWWIFPTLSLSTFCKSHFLKHSRHLIKPWKVSFKKNILSHHYPRWIFTTPFSKSTGTPPLTATMWHSMRKFLCTSSCAAARRPRRCSVASNFGTFKVLEPICPLFCLQKKVFSNRNKGHLGSRFRVIKDWSTDICTLYVRLMLAEISSPK